MPIKELYVRMTTTELTRAEAGEAEDRMGLNPGTFSTLDPIFPARNMKRIFRQSVMQADQLRNPTYKNWKRLY